MQLLKSPTTDSELHELIRASGKRIIYTVGGLYLAAHIIATLGFPETFNPGIWAVSIYMLGLVVLSAHIVDRRYLLSQLLWILGLAGAIILAYVVFAQPVVVLLLMILPLFAVVTLGIPWAFLSILFLVIVTFIMQSAGLIPVEFLGFILLGSIAITVLGWSLSSSLLTALDTASYHYHEARRFLAETQDHRAEISRVLKDRNQINYQLERMNDMLASARALAEEAHENRNRFMLAVSHELRTPLNFIIGFSDLMVNAPMTYAPLEKWPPGLYDDIQEVYNSSNHLLRLINDILDLGKIDAGQMALFREKTQLEQVLDDVRGMLSSAFDRKGIQLLFDLPEELPSVFVDVTRIRQVLINLLNNGLRFTDQGSVTIQVESMASHLLVHVIDTGTGITPEDLPKVFEEFRQVGEENWRRHAGSGLGLYISRRFVELHGGRMGVESEPGHGSHFHFTIPYMNPATNVPLPVSPERTTGEAPLILLVTPQPEDEGLLRHLLDGYEIQTVPTNEEAKAQVRNLFPRAILVAAEAGTLDAQSLPYVLPVVYFCLPRTSTAIRNLHAHLVKPVSRQALLDVIEALGPDVRRLMVVDDDPAMVRFVRQSFRAGNGTSGGRDYSIITVLNGKEALDILADHAVDAILLDLELPDISGWEWLLRVQGNEKIANIPVIIVSAQDAPLDSFVLTENALELTLRRPLSKQELGSVLKAVLDNVLPQYPKTD